ncbi:MAG: ferritin [Rhodothermaceae bacterium]
MISKRMEEELNKQINAEFYSSYLYLSMAAWFDSQNLAGFSNWMNVQAQEEWAHGLKIFNFVNERGGKVSLAKIDEPKTEWTGIINVYEDVLEHEQKITSLINQLSDIAIEESDHATKNFLHWFVDEQVEEEASVDNVLQQLKMIDGKGTGLFLLDREMQSRVFVPIDGNN